MNRIGSYVLLQISKGAPNTSYVTIICYIIIQYSLPSDTFCVSVRNHFAVMNLYGFGAPLETHVAHN